MHWEGKFGPAFIATVFFAVVQLGVIIFGAGRIWSDVQSTQKASADTAIVVSAIKDQMQTTQIQSVKRDGVVDNAIGELKTSIGWLQQAVQRIQNQPSKTAN